MMEDPTASGETGTGNLGPSVAVGSRRNKLFIQDILQRTCCALLLKLERHHIRKILFKMYSIFCRNNIYDTFTRTVNHSWP